MNNTDAHVLDFKSATLYAIRIVLHSADPKKLATALAKRMADASHFFKNEPVVIDALRVDAPIDWQALLNTLQDHHLPPLGVIATGENLRAAQTLGLTPIDVSSPATLTARPESSETSTQPNSEPPTPDPQSASALVITKPLRSGQRVYARHTDLIVIGMVSPGAEVIADGNVHVYGPLRGKAMAGARGDTSARIFTTHLEGELLAVAGVYRVVEDKFEANLHGQPALVRLDGDTLHIEALKA